MSGYRRRLGVAVLVQILKSFPLIDRIHDKRRESVDGGKDAETLIGIILFACFRMPFRYKQRRIRPWKTVRLGKKENARDVKAGNALKKGFVPTSGPAR